jgi:pimeloyl-ACP methyl ester carboxylesterase
VSDQLAAGNAKWASFDTSSGAIAALVSGDRAAAPVLLLPGYTGSKEDFAPLLDPLAGSGRYAVAIDLPGQFESPGPSQRDSYRTDLLAVTVREVAAQLGQRVHLVGHSFGGLVARAAAIADPGAFDSLVLMCSGPAGIGGRRRMLIDQLEPVLASSGLAAVYAVSEAAARNEVGYVAPPPALGNFLQRRFLAGVPAMLAGMGDALRSEPDRVAELAASGVPTLVLHGADDDAWAPRLQGDMARRLGARLVVLGDAGHSPAVENPADTAQALIQFWDESSDRMSRESG